MGTREEYVKIMIDSGNTVGKEFAERLGLEGDDIRDHIAVPTAAAATTLLVVKKCRGVTARLAGIAGELTLRQLVVRGLTHPVNLGQHFLGRHWCSLDFATGCTQLGVWGQSVQLVGRLASRPRVPLGALDRWRPLDRLRGFLPARRLAQGPCWARRWRRCGRP